MNVEKERHLRLSVERQWDRGVSVLFFCIHLPNYLDSFLSSSGGWSQLDTVKRHHLNY